MFFLYIRTMIGSQRANKNLPHKLILLGIILVSGFILHQLGIFDWHRFLDLGGHYASRWWFPAAVILVKAFLYMFALPGSSMYWVAGLFFEPLIATPIVVAGGVSGAILAYLFSQKLSADSVERISSSRFFRVIRDHSDFPTLCAIRTLPNFPHSVINYGSGILRVPLPRFIGATIIGFAAKGFLYTSAIHHAATADYLSDAIRLETILPLIGLTVLFLAGKFLQRRLPRKPTAPERETP